MRKTIQATRFALPALVALVAGASLSAQAADLSQPALDAQDPAPMVELGSGWYLRGDIGYVNMSVPVGLAPSNVNPLAAAPPGQTIFGSGTSHYGELGATIGAGYQFNSWFRTDATFDWRQNHTVEIGSYGLGCALDVTNPVTGTATLTNNGGCYRTDTIQMQSWTGLLNAYGDLGNWFGVTPYIGAGIGLSHIRATAQENWFWDYGAPYGGSGFNSYYSGAAGVLIHYGYPGNIGPSQNPTNLSWALMAGVSFELAPHVRIDIGYRYLNMGSIDVMNAWGQAVHHTVDSQEARAGLRFTPDL